MRRATLGVDTVELVLEAKDGAEFSFSSGSLADETEGSLSSFSRLEVEDRSFEDSRTEADIRRVFIGALMVLGVARAEAPEGMREGVAELALSVAE